MAEDIPDLLVSVGRRIRHAARRELEPLGITPAQMRAMRVIAGADGPVRMTALADGLGIAKRSATDVVESLVAGGFAERLADPCDGRAVVVCLTPAGCEVRDGVAVRRREAARHLLDVLTPGEQSQLATLLTRLVDAPAP